MKGLFQAGAPQQKPAVAVRNGQRMAVAPCHQKMALEVGAPDRVRAIESAQLRTVTDAWSAPPTLSYQPLRTKQASDCAGRWKLDSRVIALEDGQQLAWPPTRAAFSNFDDELDNAWWHGARIGMRPARPINESLEPTFLETSEPLVALLSTDPEPLANRAERLVAVSAGLDTPATLLERSRFFPWHAASSHRVSPLSSVRFDTDVPGPNL